MLCHGHSDVGPLLVFKLIPPDQQTLNRALRNRSYSRKGLAAVNLFCLCCLYDSGIATAADCIVNCDHTVPSHCITLGGLSKDTKSSAPGCMTIVNAVLEGAGFRVWSGPSLPQDLRTNIVGEMLDFVLNYCCVKRGQSSALHNSH